MTGFRIDYDQPARKWPVAVGRGAIVLINRRFLAFPLLFPTLREVRSNTPPKREWPRPLSVRMRSDGEMAIVQPCPLNVIQKSRSYGKLPQPLLLKIEHRSSDLAVASGQKREEATVI